MHKPHGRYMRSSAGIFEVVAVVVGQFADVPTVEDASWAEMLGSVWRGRAGLRLAKLLLGLKPIGIGITLGIWATLDEDFVGAFADGVFAGVCHRRRMARGRMRRNTGNDLDGTCGSESLRPLMPQCARRSVSA